MKRKVMWTIGIGVLLVLIVGVVWLIEIQNHHTDPNWQIANEIYKVENTMKEVDEDYKFQSVSKATPFTILILKEIPSCITAVKLRIWKMSLVIIPDWT